MTVLNKFTFRSIKLNKKRAIVTIVGIILSTALICATSGLITSIQASLINHAIESKGDYHVKFLNVAKEEQKYITQNRNVTTCMYTQAVGYANLKESQNIYKPYIFLMEYDKSALDNLSLNIISGRKPENSNELLISQHIKTNALVNWKVGDKITLEVGTRYSQGNIADQNQPCYVIQGDVIELEGDKEKLLNEEIKPEFTKEYTIVGIMSRLDYTEEPYDAPGYTVITYMDNLRESSNLYVKYDNIKNTYKNTNVINGLDEDASFNTNNAKYDVDYNTQLLQYSGVSKNDSTNQMLYTLAAIVIAIIVGTSVFVIRNSFHISITEKFKQYGILASIGATSKQIKHNVLYEGFVLGVIAIPLGILSGIFATWVLIMLLNLILKDFIKGDFIYKIPALAIFVSTVISIITIYLSCLLPARKAAKIAPIDAIRANNDIKIKSRKLRMPKIIRKIFGIGGELAWKSLKRSRKKYRTTVISIFVSIVVFLSLYSAIEYGFKLSNIYYMDMKYNVVVMSSDIEQNVDFNEILSLNNIQEYNIPKRVYINVNFEKYANKDLKVYGYAEQDGKKVVNATVYSLSEEQYDKYLQQNNLNKKEYENKGILLDKRAYYIEDKYYEEDTFNIKNGDTLEGTIEVYNSETKKNEIIKDISIQIGKRVDTAPMGLESYKNVTPLIIVSDKMMEQFGNYSQNRLYIQSNDAFKLEEDIKNLNTEKEKWVINNYEEDKKENDAMILVISIFLYGFITVITLIGVTNIFNTITTNMALRSKEFAMLKSIGMTNKEFNRMIRLESIFYGLKSLILGIPVGLILSYVIFNVIADKYYIKYVIPYKQVLLCVLFVFAIIYITMKYSQSKIDKQNIIETIRNENI